MPTMRVTLVETLPFWVDKNQVRLLLVISKLKICGLLYSTLLLPVTIRKPKEKGHTKSRILLHLALLNHGLAWNSFTSSTCASEQLE